MAVLARKLTARRGLRAAAGKSTLNRLELSRLQSTRYHKISHNLMARRLFIDLCLDGHEEGPSQIILDLGALDDPAHGEQKVGFSMAITTVTATCRSTPSAGTIRRGASAEPSRGPPRDLISADHSRP